MKFFVQCLKCGALWWQRGEYEPDTNALCLDDSYLPEGICLCCSDVLILDGEVEDYECSIELGPVI